MLSSPRNRLTVRQKQFWEDVETGILSISQTSIPPRINSFLKIAQWQTSPPLPSAPFHDPCEEYIPGLTAKPYWSSDDDIFPWIERLESESESIINEFFTVLSSSSSLESSNLFSSDSAWQNDVMGSGWSAIRLQRLGEWSTPTCSLFPKTYNILKSLNIPLAVRGVCFAKQSRGSGVAAHSDGRNFILTSHLGLRIPEGEGVWMEVGGVRKKWKEGKVVTIDTSFVHETKNEGKGDRYVLIVDFWHPELTEVERECLEFVYDLRNRFERGEVPVRELRKSYDDEREEEGKGIKGIWGALTGKK
ncbi:hypothetical protein TrVE_jg13770 [Triparma verrucosa]|uniref:Aspartyl/asparaginy/proline hydroxylase domain-containing protein n=1 Tax=Triparma verrucosa TaxID=1606542 RepID=A0A9W7CEK5_9STRA|nr:hypothetical protein TrVE_jg13770 [Triparma verrucosa]